MAKLYGSYRQLRALYVAVSMVQADGFDGIKEMTAAQWHRLLSIPPRKKSEGRTAFKQRLRRRAVELFPHTRVTLATADALLLAHCCRLIHEQETKEKTSAPFQPPAVADRCRR